MTKKTRTSAAKLSVYRLGKRPEFFATTWSSVCKTYSTGKRTLSVGGFTMDAAVRITTDVAVYGGLASCSYRQIKWRPRNSGRNGQLPASTERWRFHVRVDGSRPKQKWHHLAGTEGEKAEQASEAPLEPKTLPAVPRGHLQRLLGSLYNLDPVGCVRFDAS